MDDFAELDFILNADIAGSVSSSVVAPKPGTVVAATITSTSDEFVDLEIDILQRAIDLAAVVSEVESADEASPLQPAEEITYEDLNLLDECYQHMVQSDKEEAASVAASLKRSFDESDDDDDDEDDPFFGSSSDEDMSKMSVASPSAFSPSTVANNAKRRKSSDSSCSASDGNKKESNKAAATKYRLKKVREKGELFERRDALVKRNQDMKEKLDEVQCEINYIKSLLLEALISKNANK